MDLYDHPSLTNFDALQQLRLAAKSMRDLAFGLDEYASDPGLPAIHKISEELSRIGSECTLHLHVDGENWPT